MSDKKSLLMPCKIDSCKNMIILYVHTGDLINWENGQLVQEAFPYLSAEEREMLVSGICGECWVKIFPPEEEV